MKKQSKHDKKRKLQLLHQSRPRPEVRNRPAVFANKKKYKRSRDKKVTVEE